MYLKKHLLSFFWINRPGMILLGSVAEQIFYLFLLKNGPESTVWFDRTCYVRVDSSFVPVLNSSLKSSGGTLFYYS